MITPVHVSGALDNRSATWVNVIRNRAQHRPERVLYTFLVDGDARESRLTDRELDQRARAIAGKLQQLLPGDRVLLLYLPGLDYIAAFFGCLRPSRPPRSLQSFHYFCKQESPGSAKLL